MMQQIHSTATFNMLMMIMSEVQRLHFGEFWDFLRQ